MTLHPIPEFTPTIHRAPNLFAAEHDLHRAELWFLDASDPHVRRRLAEHDRLETDFIHEEYIR